MICFYRQLDAGVSIRIIFCWLTWVGEICLKTTTDLYLGKKQKLIITLNIFLVLHFKTTKNDKKSSWPFVHLPTLLHSAIIFFIILYKNNPTSREKKIFLTQNRIPIIPLSSIRCMGTCIIYITAQKKRNILYFFSSILTLSSIIFSLFLSLMTYTCLKGTKKKTPPHSFFYIFFLSFCLHLFYK